MMSPRRSPSPQRFLGKRILQETSQPNVAKLPGNLEKLQNSITKRLQAQPSKQGKGLQDSEPLESPVFKELPPSISSKFRLRAIDEPRHPRINQPNRSPSPDENDLSEIWKASSSTAYAKTLPPLPLELIGREELGAHPAFGLRLAGITAAGGMLLPRSPSVLGDSLLQVNAVTLRSPRPTSAQANKSRFSEQTHQEALRRYDLQLARYRDSFTPVTQVKRVNDGNQVMVSSFLPKGKVAEELMAVLEENEGAFVCPAYPLLNNPDGWQAYKQMAKTVKKNPSIVEPLHNAQAQLHLGDEIYRRMEGQRSEAQMQDSWIGASPRDADPSNQTHGLSRTSSTLLQNRRLSIVNLDFMTEVGQLLDN